MRKTVRYAVAQGLAAGLVLALSACGGDPEPRFEEEPSPTPSEVTSSAPAKEAWEEKSPEGAVAFAEHWLAAFNQAENSGDVAELRLLSSRECESCSNFVAAIQEVYGSGGRMRSDGWRVLSVGEPTLVDQGYSVPLQVEQSDQEVVAEAGAKPQLNRGIKIGLAAQVSWTQSTWKMQRLDIVQ